MSQSPFVKWFQVMLFNTNSSIIPRKKIEQSGHESNDNEGVLHKTRASPSDAI